MRLTLGILPPGCQQEIFDFFNLARLRVNTNELIYVNNNVQERGGSLAGQEGGVRGPVELKSPRGSRNSALGPSLLLQDCDASRARQPEMFGRLANG